MLRANPEDTAGHPGRTGLSLNRSDFLAARGQQQASVSAASEPSDVGTAGLKAVGTEHSYKGGTGICLEIRLWETPRNRAGGGENPCYSTGFALQFSGLALESVPLGLSQKSRQKLQERLLQ